MRAKKTSSRNRFLAGLLAVVMIVSMLPASVFATADDDLLEALSEAKDYTDAITIDSASNDPATVVSKFKTHFTWDNEKRENSKSYLFDWSYYNGVVFEGIEYLYETTGEEAYKDYVVEYMSSLITEDGDWATCSNNTAKQCAGYNATHGADCYKTASLLLDTYEMTGDKRYLTMAETLYADLDAAAETYSLSKAGGNYRHTWASDPSPDLWLDGLYMILPFRAEYAEYIEDTAELDLIVDRMQWVSDNMYNAETGLFYHAADSATSNSGTYWLRSIGWYAAAIVDIMDCMEGENLEAMKAQLVKLVNGMKACQDSGNGMWLNNMAASESASNPYETSGTALVSYAVMKAVNKGWLDESYADMAIAAFEGICNEKLSGTTLTDICFKGVPSGSNSTFYDNEGKGVGPFIMLYAEVQEYVDYLESEPEVTEETFTFEDAGNILKVTATATAMSAKNVSGEVEAVAELLNDDYTAYEFSLNDWEKNTDITVALSLGAAYDEQTLTVYYIDSNGTAKSVSGNYVVGTDKDGFQIVTISDAAEGTYAFGAPYVKVDANATLTGLEITNAPDIAKYFVGETDEDGILPLDITGLVVEATYSDGTTREIPWNEFGEVEDGYSLTVDMTVLGDQEVEVSYTYGEVTLTDSFTITIYDEVFSEDNSSVTIQVTVPGVTDIFVNENTAEDFVVAAAEKVLESYVSYDIELEGYTQGEEVTVTLPIPAGVEKAAVYYIPEDGSEPEDMGGANNGDGTISFTTDHFSTYAVGSRAGDVLEGTGNLAGGKVYTLDTNGVTADKNYLIVSANSGTGYALTNNNGTAGRTQVTISNSTIAVKDDSNIAWQFSGTTSGTVSNNGRYVYPGNNSLSLNPSGTSLTISNQGSGAYRIYRTETTSSGWWGEETTNYYYLRYRNNAWTGRTNSGNVYLYELTSSSSGEAVTFAIDPANTTVIPGGTLNLNGTVTVAGETVDLSKCDITWVSSDTDYATVSNGIVTGGTDGGSAVITASLTEVDGKALVTPIALSVTVTVASKTITGVRLIDAETVETTVNTQPDFSNVLLKVTYTEGEPDEIDGNDNRITITGYDITQNGTYFATVKYGEEELGTVTVIVKPSYPSDKAETYPEYPADGAVRIKKTAEEIDFDDTGVVKVELDVAGISVRKGVNVILISDISNSMSWDDSTYSYSDVTVTAGTNQRLNISKASAKAFVNELLTPADGQKNLNTVTLLAFAGIDGDYNDHSTASANDDVYQLGDLAMMDIAAAEEAINQQKKATTGGTNYDYAFQQAYALAGELYKLNGQEVHIVFMTDGVPTHYNGVYYKSRNNTDLTGLMNYVDPTTGETSRYTSTGNDRNGNDIDATATTGITVYYNDGTTATKNVTYNKGWSDYVINNQNGWAEKTKDLDYVAKVYSIGFGMKNGSVTQGATSSMPTLNNNGGQYYIPSSTTQTLLKHISSTADDYYEADNQEELQALYESLATQIKFAGTSAQATDVISSDFTLQMAETSGTGERQPVLDDYGITPSITIKAYDLLTKDETTDAALIGTRSGDVTDIEEVTFSAGGSEAYSDQIDDGDTNIMTKSGDDIVITAKYFTYSNIDGYESFSWNIGNITDKEIALSFYAYLKGSMEGEESKGTRYTNEEAYLEYIDINGDYAVQVFPKPVVVWGGASTAYEFYLVNDKGEPVNRNGDVIPFANRIVITGPYYEELNLNAGDNYYSKEIVAAKVLPAGYTLYDDTSYYTVKTASGDAEEFAGSLKISEPAAGKAQTTICISFTEHSYIQSHVAFGVLYNEIPDVVEYFMTPDAVVFDYGKPMAIDISTNNTGIPSGYTGTLVGFSKYYDYTEDDLKKYYSSVTSMTEYDTDFGVFTISDGEVLYTPTAITKAVDRVYCIIRIVEDGNSQNVVYMVNPLSVIPATSVYYETDFSLKDGAVNPAVFALTSDWDSKEKGDAADAPQDEGTIGVNQTYGYDSSYENDAYLSNGTSLFVEGQGVKVTTAKFSFTGTGFDIISRTGAAQGAIRVEVFTDINRTTANRVRSITVLNKSESALELYQIPVVSVNDLPYDTYYVTIGVNKAYTNDTYPELERGGEFYFDALRVFNPINTKDNTADALDAASAYRQDGELNPQVDEVRQMMLDAKTFNPDNISGAVEGVVFVDSTYTTEETENGSETTPDHKTGSVEIGTYAAIGPNNEVYLENGQAIAFKVNASSMPASFDVGAKSITGVTAILNAVVTDGADTDMQKVAEVTSSTAQNFNLMEYVVNDALADGTAYVIISNSGEGVLSITDLKVAFGGTSRVRMMSMRPETTAVVDEEDAEVEPVVVYSVDAATYAVASAVLLNVEEDTPDTEEKPEAEKPKPGKPEKPDKEKPAKPEKPNKPDKDFEDDKPDKNDKPNKNDKPGQNNKPGKQNNGKGNRK